MMIECQVGERVHVRPKQSAATTICYQVALLHYNDGLSRQMMLAEAVSQILNCI